MLAIYLAVIDVEQDKNKFEILYTVCNFFNPVWRNQLNPV